METEQATKAQAVGDGATAIHGARLHLLPGLCEGVSGPLAAVFFCLWWAATCTTPPNR